MGEAVGVRREPAAPPKDEAGTGDLALSANTVAGAIVIGAAYAGGTVSFTWSGLSEQVDTTVAGGSNKWTVAIASNVSAETPRAISVTTGVSGNMLGAGVAAVFTVPAAGGGLPIAVAMAHYRRMRGRAPRSRHPQPDGYIRRPSGLYMRDTTIQRAA